MNKIFVLDTNVILHDSGSIFNFAEHDVVIPITVIEEIDNFKRGHDLIHFHAREFVRHLDTFPGDRLIGKGASLGKGHGKIFILTQYDDAKEVNAAFLNNTADHRIISSALYLNKKHRSKQVILVSKDVNLRLKARSVGLKSEDYFNDKIEDITKLYQGKRLIENIPGEVIDQIYKEPEDVPISETGIENPIANEYYILRNHNKSLLAYHNPIMKTVEHVQKKAVSGVIPRNAEQTFALHALLNPDVQLVSLSGKAGTGKTLLALAAAIESKRRFRQILLARPVVALSNKDIGYLPGDIKSKLDPYMQPLYDNLSFIRNQYKENDPQHQKFQEMLDKKKLEIVPLAYIRGRSLDSMFFIIDEAQNLTPHEIKTIITRAGEGTKIVFTGDPYQIDTPYLDARSTGLTYLINRMKGQKLYAHVTLEKGERSELSELASNLL